MIKLILAALRHRRAQALTTLALTTFAVAAAVASPWYVAGAADRAAAVDLANASQKERLITVTRSVTVRDPGSGVAPIAAARSTVVPAVDLPGLVAVAGATENASIKVGTGTTNLPVAYRDEMCAHLTIIGSCPTRTDEALLSTGTAERLGFRIGDPVIISPAFGDPRPLTLVGTYDYVEPAGDYWAGSRYVGAIGAGTAATEPLFVAAETFGGGALDQITVTEDLRLPDETLRGTTGASLSDRVSAAAYELNQQGYSTEFLGEGLANRVALDQDAIRIGVPVGAAQLLALCWFAFFIAGRYAARERRSDIALLKLRGTTALRQLRLTAGQSALPMLAGLVLGSGLGVVAARLLAGAVRPETQAQTLRISVLAAVLAVLGGLAAALVAQLPTLRTPVSELLRGVPPRRRGWRTDLVDLLVIAVAVAAAYQAKVQGTGRVAGLAPLARGLVILAVALLLARVIGLLVAGVGRSAVRAGRLRFALGALQITRRPGMDRVFALLMVAVAGLCTTAVDWSAASSARTARATVEVGAARVVSVQSQNRWQLLSAVRAVDPDGTRAMAVVYRPGGGSGAPPVLAVDAGRLAKVGSWQGDAYGSRSPAELAALLRPGAPQQLRITGTSITVQALADAPATWLVARVLNLTTGLPQQVGFGPLTPTLTSYTSPVTCATGAGCRLLSFGVAGRPSDVPGGFLPTLAKVTVEVHGLRQSAPDATVADAAVLGDVHRWRTGFGKPGLVVDSAHGVLRLVDGDPSTQVDQRAFVLDSAVPLPVVTVGSTARLWALGDPSLSPLGGDALPIRIAASAPVLPVLGTTGVMVDLVSAAMLDSNTVGLETQQVWLSRDAPAGIVDQLRANGLTVLRTTSIDANTAALAGQGPTAALRFALFAALLGVLLAATGVAVAGAGETAPRSEELRALHAQGLSGGTARAVSYGGYAGLVLAGVLGGLLAALLARLFVDTGLPVFVDSWDILATDTGLRAYPLLLACLGALALLGASAAIAGARLVRAIGLRHGGRPDRSPPREQPPPDRQPASAGAGQHQTGGTR